ncbi:hypothetical protein BV898_06347 [Hypsibius exemplaris]|uniref:28S ribosomal protein S34, mitochondrial n=1 Tax=Hypsibius exemplaris TaxID=2072580 RepID=A0A1W0WWK4_HYPEX|nr:hypothetical protein BV898_06347 [Hypsibius exemplaris]
MPIRIVGKPNQLRGKYLFEILRNLKDFGVGRTVVRSLYERYPEPTYFVVRTVQPGNDPEGQVGTMTATHVFRGRNFGDVEVMDGHFADWRLIPKEEEAEYKATYRPGMELLPKRRVVPAAEPFPPLLKLMLRDEAVKEGKPWEKEPMLPLVIHRGVANIPIQEGVEAPIGAAQHPDNPISKMLPQSVAVLLARTNYPKKK